MQPSFPVLGVRVDAVQMCDVVARLRSWLEEPRSTARFVAVTGMHGIAESRRDAYFRRILNAADLVVPDGMPLVWLGQVRGHALRHRVCGSELMEAFCRTTGRDYRHFFYGGAAGVAEKLAHALHEKHGIAIAGSYTPPFRPLTESEENELASRLEEASPDVLWVGLSTPKQEKWMYEHRFRLKVPLMLAVGAAFDMNSGRSRRAPRWMRERGLEWLYRLCTDPRRLWRRYLITIPQAVWFVCLELLGWRIWTFAQGKRGTGDATRRRHRPIMKNHKRERILVTGAGGFIGHHLVKRLKCDGFWVRGADIKLPEYEASEADEFLVADLRKFDNCLLATRGGIDQVYNLAADMGGIGYINAFHADIARNNVLINTHMLEASRLEEVSQYLYSSSACVYASSKQTSADVTPLREEDAYPADPEPGYGWEKLFAEELCSYYRLDYKFETRIVRFHNVYGPLGTYEGGKEKAPAAICRKMALAADSGEIEIWGDGEQTRSFLYVDDCVEGLVRLMASDYHKPLNLGTDRLISINALVDLISGIAGKRLIKNHDLSKPQGVRGRNSDNTRLRDVLDWEPSFPLEAGLQVTYKWIEAELKKAGRIQGPRRTDQETLKAHAASTLSVG